MSTKKEGTNVQKPGRPTIGILLSNYNHADCVERALVGIFGQQRPADEVLLLDDGSDDGSIEILRAYANKSPKAKLFEHAQNRGLLTSIAFLLQQAESDYVVWAASDDELLPDFLKESEMLLRKHPDVGVCFSEFNLISEPDTEPVNYSRDPDILGTKTDRARNYRLYDIPEFLSPTWLVDRYSDCYLCMSSNTVLMNRKMLVAMGGFPEKLKWYADWFAVAALAFRYGACSIPKSLTIYHAAESSFSAAGINNRSEQRRVMRAWLELLHEKHNADLKSMFLNAPAVFAPFGFELMLAGCLRPRYWPLVFANFRWLLFGLPSRSGLTWPHLMKKIALRLLSKHR